MIRYLFLCPPPLCRMVILPFRFLPPKFFLEEVRDFSGLDLVMSAKSETDLRLCPGVIGFNFLMPIVFFLGSEERILTIYWLKYAYRSLSRFLLSGLQLLSYNWEIYLG